MYSWVYEQLSYIVLSSVLLAYARVNHYVLLNAINSSSLLERLGMKSNGFTVFGQHLTKDYDKDDIQILPGLHEVLLVSRPSQPMARKLSSIRDCVIP